MSQQNLTKLSSQGRAFSSGRAWSAEELTALLTLEKGAKLARKDAAEYIRNGIMTVDDYEKAKEAGVKPLSLEEMQAQAIIDRKKEVEKQLNSKKEEEPVNEKKAAKK